MPNAKPSHETIGNGVLNMIVVSGVMTFDPSAHDRVVQLARVLTTETLKEPGCLTYGFWADPDLRGTVPHLRGVGVARGTHRTFCHSAFRGVRPGLH